MRLACLERRRRRVEEIPRHNDIATRAAARATPTGGTVPPGGCSKAPLRARTIEAAAHIASTIPLVTATLASRIETRSRRRTTKRATTTAAAGTTTAPVRIDGIRPLP